jgi:hypothetical protein
LLFNTEREKVTGTPRQGRREIYIVQVLHYIVWIIVFTLSATCVLCAQETGKMELRDTLVKRPRINQYLLRNFDTDIMLLPSLRGSMSDVPVSLHQSLMNIPSSLSAQFEMQIDVVSPWKQELAKQNELRTLKTILGAIQAGGTAYLLYEHIRKYGLK